MTTPHWDDASIKRLTVHLLWTLLLIGSVNIAISAYSGLSGPFVWRPSDVYAQILGFTDQKKFSSMENFFGERVIYDIPIYQYVVGRFSSRLSADPLVVARVVNVICWIALILVSYQLVERRQEGAGKYLAAMLTVAPLYIYYFSTPLPDNMALPMALIAIYLPIAHRRNGSLLCASVVLIGIASLIKSPIAFVVVVYFGALLLLTDLRQLLTPFVVSFFAVAAVCAVLAELSRTWFLGVSAGGFAQYPTWYFGTLELRLSPEFLERMFRRTFGGAFPQLDDGSSPQALSGAVAPPTGRGPLWHYLIGITLCSAGSVILLSALAKRAAILKDVLVCLVAFASGWFVFSNLYYLHNYYQYPSSLFFLMGGALLAAWGERQLTFVPNWLPLLLILALTPLTLVMTSAKRELAITSAYDVMAFILTPVDRVLYVAKPYGGERLRTPEMGGRLRTKLDVVETELFEGDCSGIARRYEAVLVRGDSNCANDLARLYGDRFVSPPFQLFYGPR